MTLQEKISLYLTGAISAEPVAKVTIDDAINAYSGTFTAYDKVSKFLTGAKVVSVVQNDDGGINLLLADDEGNLFVFNGSTRNETLTELLAVNAN